MTWKSMRFFLKYDIKNHVIICKVLLIDIYRYNNKFIKTELNIMSGDLEIIIQEIKALGYLFVDNHQK